MFYVNGNFYFTDARFYFTDVFSSFLYIFFHSSYAKAYDPDNLFTIDAETAEIKLKRTPDRESPYLKNGTYIAKILAIPKGNSLVNTKTSLLLPPFLIFRFEGYLFPYWRISFQLTTNKILVATTFQILLENFHCGGPRRIRYLTYQVNKPLELLDCACSQDI